MPVNQITRRCNPAHVLKVISKADELYKNENRHYSQILKLVKVVQPDSYQKFVKVY